MFKRGYSNKALHSSVDVSSQPTYVWFSILKAKLVQAFGFKIKPLRDKGSGGFNVLGSSA